jgi:hypothetical protein
MNIATHSLRIVTKSASGKYVYFISIHSTIRTQNLQCPFMNFFLTIVTEKLKARGRCFAEQDAYCSIKLFVLSQTRKLHSMTRQNLYRGHQIQLGRKVYYNARLASPFIQLPRLLRLIQCS